MVLKRWFILIIPFLDIAAILILRHAQMQHPNTTPRTKINPLHHIRIHKYPRLGMRKLVRRQHFVLHLIQLLGRRDLIRWSLRNEHQRNPRAQFSFQTVGFEIRPSIHSQLVRHGHLGVYIAALDVQFQIDRDRQLAPIRRGGRRGRGRRIAMIIVGVVMMTSFQWQRDQFALAATPARDDLEGVAFGYRAGETEEEAAVEGHGIGVDPVHVAHVTAYFA
mmetsp:Transcript_17916/g.32061  ORF Transcript_17916/g.32061 Transcript_17916/m.32061 type:complete len:220 (+) Transcript_17916:232-891(+)